MTAQVDDFPEKSISQPSQGISTLLLVDYLNEDIRPALIVDLEMEAGSRPPPHPPVVFFNRALIGANSLYEEMVDVFDGSKEDFQLEDGQRRFRNWVTAIASTIEKPDKERSQLFRGRSWAASVLQAKWAVISGVHQFGHEGDSLSFEQERARTTEKYDALSRTIVSRGPQSSGVASSVSTRETGRSKSDAGSDVIWPSLRLPESDHILYFRQFDWGSTALGLTEFWTPLLRQACEIMLVNPDPVVLLWGEDFVLLYNGAYAEVIGSKHPRALGRPGEFSFEEIWDVYGPFYKGIRQEGQSVKQVNVPLSLLRGGFMEELFCDFTFIPVFDSDGSIAYLQAGLLEVTKQTLSERRLHTLLRLSERNSSATSLKDLWRLVLSALNDHDVDVHFAVLYSREQKRQGSETPSGDYLFEGAIGLSNNDKDFPQVLNVKDKEEHDQSITAAFRSAIDSRSAVLLKVTDGSLSDNFLQTLQNCGMQGICRELVAIPLLSDEDDSNTAVLVLGANPKRNYDDDYRIFVQLLQRQVENAIGSLKLFENEKTRLKAQAAHESEIKLRRFAECAPVGIWISDKVSKLTFCNESWLKISGHPRDDLSAMSWIADYHPDCIDQAVATWREMGDLRHPLTLNVQYKKPWNLGNGSIALDRTYVVQTILPDISEEGTLLGFMSCVVDVSYQKLADRLHAERLSEAMELKRQQENFLDITSHEMRNPLNAILHCASDIIELLTEETMNVASTDDGSSPRLQDCLEAAKTIAYCGRHQKRIVDDVLTLSKLDSDLLSVSPVATRPQLIVEEVLKIFDAELRTANIRTFMNLSASCEKEGIDHLLLDPHRVLQILINLVANAIKFMKEQTYRSLRILINISAKEPTSQSAGVRYAHSGRARKILDPIMSKEWGEGDIVFLQICVQDTGPGMTQEEANSLFSRFVQTPRTHSKYGGSGLGLFISRELAELHGGRVGLSTQVGGGSTFDFYVKCRRATERPRSGSRSQNSPDLILRASEQIMRGRRSQDEMRPPPRTIRSSPTIMQGAATPVKTLGVLIVEDNLVNQKILSKMMRKAGFETRIANHGGEALAVIEASRWALDQEDIGTKLDVVLCDIEMPVMDGKECVRRIRELQRDGKLCPNIPVIAVTGNARREQVDAARMCGFDDVVTKPYQAGDLMMRIYSFAKNK